MSGILRFFSLGNPDIGSDASLAGIAQEGELWPDKAGACRVKCYERWLNLYLGKHEGVLEPDRDDDSEGNYYAVNLCSRSTKLLASRLAGQTPQPHPKTEGGAELTPEQETQAEVLNAILLASRWDILVDRAIQGHSYRGDAVLKAVYDGEADAVKLRSILPGWYWPEYDEDDSDKLLSASIVWEVEAEDPKDKATYLREERHTPGLIENLLWRAVLAQGVDVEQGQYRREPVPLGTLTRFAEVEESIPTGIDVIPLVLIPNMPIDETQPWGISDYAQPEDLQRGVNRSVSRAWNISDKHEELFLAVDESFVDEYRNMDFQKKVLPMVQQEQPPQYIMYPGDASQSLAQGQEMMLWFCLVAGISPESLGLGGEAPAESGYAIRLRQMLTTSTVEKKRVVLDNGFRTILSAAMKLHQAHVVQGPKALALEPYEIAIDWSDGLPEDQMAEVQKASVIKTSALPVPDIELLRMMFPNLGEEALQAMLETAKAESEEAMLAPLESMQAAGGGSTEIGEGNLEGAVAAQEGEGA